MINALRKRSSGDAVDRNMASVARINAGPGRLTSCMNGTITEARRFKSKGGVGAKKYVTL